MVLIIVCNFFQIVIVQILSFGKGIVAALTITIYSACMTLNLTMPSTFQATCLYMCLVYSMSADALKGVQTVSRMRYVTVDRDMDSSINISSRHATTLVGCAAKCTTHPNTLSLYFVAKYQTCYCNADVDVSIGNDIVGESTGENVSDADIQDVIYGYFKQLAEVLDDGGTRRVRTIPLMADCLELYNGGYSVDGVYTILPAGLTPVDVWCDMKDGGWTVFQRRLDGSVDFYRDWSDYVSGFGNKSGEYWLGLDTLHALTSQQSELHIYLEAFEGKSPSSAYVRYSSFAIDGPTLNYVIHVSGLNESCGGDPFHIGNNQQFSTFDREYDTWPEGNCAETYRGAWWYGLCHTANLNGYYYGGEQTTWADGINWEACWGHYYSVKKTVMKVRRN